jgi:hypothetical protein
MSKDCRDVQRPGNYYEQDYYIFNGGIGGSHAETRWYPRENSHSLNIDFTAVNQSVVFMVIKTNGINTKFYKADAGTSCSVVLSYSDGCARDMYTYYQ